MILEITKRHTTLISDISNQILSLISNSDIIMLFSSLGLKGLDYISQLFFIILKEGHLNILLSSASSQKAVINFENRKTEYTSYNVIDQPNTISLNIGRYFN